MVKSAENAAAKLIYGILMARAAQDEARAAAARKVQAEALNHYLRELEAERISPAARGAYHTRPPAIVLPGTAMAGVPAGWDGGAVRMDGGALTGDEEVFKGASQVGSILAKLAAAPPAIVSAPAVSVARPVSVHPATTQAPQVQGRPAAPQRQVTQHEITQRSPASVSPQPSQIGLDYPASRPAAPTMSSPGVQPPPPKSAPAAPQPSNNTPVVPQQDLRAAAMRGANAAEANNVAHVNHVSAPLLNDPHFQHNENVVVENQGPVSRLMGPPEATAADNKPAPPTSGNFWDRVQGQNDLGKQLLNTALIGGGMYLGAKTLQKGLDVLGGESKEPVYGPYQMTPSPYGYLHTAAKI